MVPTMTDLAPAPQHLLEVIKCKCKTGCKQCGAHVKKWHGMLHGMAECRENCANVSTEHDLDDIEVDNED